MKPRIIYQDDAVIVVYKPAGLATQTARVGQADMVSELKRELAAYENAAYGKATREKAAHEKAVYANAVCGKSGGTDRAKSNGQKIGKMPENGKAQAPYLGIIHRLDQPVEGLLVFARTPKAAAELSRQLTAGSFNKQYFAVTCGKPSAKEGELVDYMVKGKDNLARIVTGQESPASKTAKSYARDEDAKKAILQYRILEDISTPAPLALADIHIETGRFHQIRCQMAHSGMPLLGDLKYGNEASLALGHKLGIRNVALCAYKLQFQHPVTRKKMSFEIKPENKAFDYFLENNFGCDCLY